MGFDQNSFIRNPGTAILREENFYFRETFAISMFIFRGAHVGQQHHL